MAHRIPDSIRDLTNIGGAVHLLRPGSKRPVNKGWSNADVLTFDDLSEYATENSNFGIRLGTPSKTSDGYIHLVDLDIRNETFADNALAELAKLWPNYAEYPTVLSGSGGSSRHFYLICADAFSSKVLAKSSTFSMVWSEEKQRDFNKNDWEIEFFGTGKQAVLPPSIHPDTRKPYAWATPFDQSLLELGIYPTLPPDLVGGWGAALHITDPDADDDLLALVTQSALDVDDKEISMILRYLPEDWVDDRDRWLTVGAALHHQFDGSNDGFTKWCEWSEPSTKYDEQDQSRVWRSFKGSANPVRLSTLIQAANHNKLQIDLMGGGDDDLFGSDAPQPVNSNWISNLQLKDDGQIKSTLPNIQIIVANDTRTSGVIAFNTFSQSIERVGIPRKFKLKKPSPKPVRQLDGPLWEMSKPGENVGWTDSHDNQIRLLLESPTRQGGYQMSVSDRDLRAAVDVVAQNNFMHPIKDYLRNLRWDGVERVNAMFVHYLGSPDTPYHRDAARLTLLGAVARIFEPGHKFDFVPILEGGQGTGKSTFIEVLGCKWPGVLSADFHDTNKMVESMFGAWVLEISELQGFSRSDTTALKAFISKTSDKARLAYERRARSFPRQCIFIGSTNDSEYLRDTTGGRRFWPIACADRNIDIQELRRNIDQLWAETVTKYLTMRAEIKVGNLPLYLSDAASLAEAEMQQLNRKVENADENLSGQIEHWLDEPIGSEFDDLDNSDPVYRQVTCLMEIWQEGLGRSPSALDQRQSQLLGRAVRMVESWKPSGERTQTDRYGRQRTFIRK